MFGNDIMTNPTQDEDEPSLGQVEVDLEPTPAPLNPTRADAPRPGLGRSSWRGAKLGMRVVSYVAGPIAVVIGTLSLALTAFAAGTGRGWALSLYSVHTVKFFFACEIIGATLGAMFGLIGGAYRLARPSTRTSGWWLTRRFSRLAGNRQEASRPIEVDSLPSPGSFWPWLVVTLTLLTLVSAFGTGFYVGWSLDRRLDRAIKAADLDDPSWRIDDLMAAREPIPDAANSALVVARVLQLLPEDWPTGPKPRPGEPIPPANDLVTAMDRLHKLPGNVQLDEATADRLRRELEAHADAVGIARTLVDYRRGRHELELGPTLIDTRLSETQASRNAARLLEIDAAIRAHDGDPAGALDSCRAIIGVARSIGDEPFTIAQLVRIAEGDVGLKAGRRTLGQREASDAALARLQALVLDELAQPVMLHGLKGDRATLTEIIRRIRDGEMPISALSEGGPPFDPDAPPTPLASWGRLMFDNQQAVALEWTNSMVDIIRQPDPKRPPLVTAWQAEFDRVRRGKLAPWTATLPMLMIPAFSVLVTAESRYHCLLGSMAILLAAERHRLKAGDWPGSIAAIDPGILAVAPVDPFTGQAFRMERRDGQLLIYSVGPNQKDEHGTVDPTRWMKDGPDDYGTGAWDVTFRRRSPGPLVENPARSPDLP
jgi:hypothetical protein